LVSQLFGAYSPRTIDPETILRSFPASAGIFFGFGFQLFILDRIGQAFQACADFPKSLGSCRFSFSFSFSTASVKRSRDAPIFKKPWDPAAFPSAFRPKSHQIQL